MRRAGLTWDGDPRVKPPFGAARVDWGHPLTHRLAVLLLCNETGAAPRDLVRNLPTQFDGTWQYPGIKTNGTNQEMTLTPPWTEPPLSFIARGRMSGSGASSLYEYQASALTSSPTASCG